MATFNLSEPFVECQGCKRKVNVRLAQDNWAWNEVTKKWGCYSKPELSPSSVDNVLISTSDQGCLKNPMIAKKSPLEKDPTVVELKQLLLKAIGTIEYLPPSYGSKWKEAEQEEFPVYKPETKDASTQTDPANDDERGASNGCYYSNNWSACGNVGFSDICQQTTFKNGARFQNQAWANDPIYPPIFQQFYSDGNIKKLQSAVMSCGGMNRPPSKGELMTFMEEAYAWDMPGAFDKLDPNRGRTDPQYVCYYVDRLNSQVVPRVVKNMCCMRESRKLYLQDICTPRGVLEIDRGIDASCKKGSSVRLDKWLPDLPCDQACCGTPYSVGGQGLVGHPHSSHLSGLFH